MILCVLRDVINSRYFVGMTVDKFQLPMAMTGDLQEAAIFCISLDGQELKIAPEIPIGNWDIVSVKVRLR